MRTSDNMVLLTERIKAHTDGITLNWSGDIPTLKGFAVSITNNKPVSLNSNDIRRTVHKMRTLNGMLGLESSFIGSWVDKDNNVFIDLTLNVPDFEQAVKVAKTFKQQAVFNFDTFEVITVQ
jgi:hypothetical protein